MSGCGTRESSKKMRFTHFAISAICAFCAPYHSADRNANYRAAAKAVWLSHKEDLLPAQENAKTFKYGVP